MNKLYVAQHQGVHREGLITSQFGVATNGAFYSDGWGQFRKMRVELLVAAASGTSPSLTVTVEDSFDGGTTYFEVGAFAAKTAPGAEAIVVDGPFADQLRINWTVAGTSPSFNFYVYAVAES